MKFNMLFHILPKVVFICFIWTAFSLPSNLQNVARGSKRYVYSESDFHTDTLSSTDNPPISTADVKKSPGSVVPFNFSIEVSDSPSGNIYSHKAKMLENDKKGEYRVGLPDGRTQIVNYFIDTSGGYNAQVKYEGEIKPYIPANQNSITEAIKRKRKVNLPFSGILEEAHWVPVQNTRKIARQANSSSLETENDNTPVESYLPPSLSNDSQKDIIKIVPQKSNVENKESQQKFSTSLFYKSPGESNPVHNQTPSPASAKAPEVVNIGSNYIPPTDNSQATVPAAGKAEQTYGPPTSNSQSKAPEIEKIALNSLPPTVNSQAAIPPAEKVRQTYNPTPSKSQAKTPDAVKVGQTYGPPTSNSQAKAPEVENIALNYLPPTVNSQATIPSEGKVGQTYGLPTSNSQAKAPEVEKIALNYLPPPAGKVGQTYNPPPSNSQAKSPEVGNIGSSYLPPSANSQAAIPPAGKIGQTYNPPTNNGKSVIPDVHVSQSYLSPSINSQSKVLTFNSERLPLPYFGSRESRQVYQPSSPKEPDLYREDRSGFGPPKQESIILHPNEDQEVNSSQYTGPRSTYNSPVSPYG